MKKKIFKNGDGEYFLFHGKHYLKDIDSRGFDKKDFVSGQYAGNFKVISFDKKYVLLEEVITELGGKIE